MRARVRALSDSGVLADLAAGREHTTRGGLHFRPGEEGEVTRLHDHGGNESCYLVDGTLAEAIASPGGGEDEDTTVDLNERVTVLDDDDDDPADCGVFTVSEDLQRKFGLDDGEVRDLQASFQHLSHPSGGDYWRGDLYDDGDNWLMFVLTENRSDPLEASPFLDPEVNAKLRERGVDGEVVVLERREREAVIAVKGGLVDEILGGWQETDVAVVGAAPDETRFFWRWRDGALDVAPRDGLNEDRWRESAESYGGTFTKIGTTGDGIACYRITGQFADALHAAILRDIEPDLMVHFAMHEPRR